MLLIGAALPLLLSFLAPPADSTADSAAVVRRIAATAQLAAQEYRIGIANGRVVAPQEVAEASLFLREARKSAAGLQGDPARTALAQIDSLIRLVASTAPADTLDARVLALSTGLSTRYQVALDEPPAVPPSLARGADIYRIDCSGCHGQTGAGDGPMAAGLDPAPADLADWAALRDQTPLDFYRRVSFGTVGTAMPAFESTLAPADRWAVALYASMLRLPPAAGRVPPSLRGFATTGKMSDDSILAVLGTHDTTKMVRQQVAAVRSFAGDSGAAATLVFDQVRAQVNAVFAMARTGAPAVDLERRALDAYMTFEQVERTVRARNPAAAAEVEAAFSALQASAAAGAGGAAGLKPIESRMAVALERAERVLGDDESPVNLFVQSFVIMLREGLEAILIVGALMTFLSKMGASHRKREINYGVGAAVAASLLTAFLLETIFILSPAKREGLEGATMIVATVVLFYVSYWLLSKMEVVKWNHFVKSKVQDALTGGSALALVSAAFLAVYREGFETVLFYKALFVSAPAGGTMPVAAGLMAGALVLVVVYVAIDRFGVRLPLKPFFAVTSAFLYYMAFVFAGKGVTDLQEGGAVGTTVVSWAPRIPALGIYPTVESLLAQAILLLLAAVALVWTFVIQPRRAPAARLRSGAGASQADVPVATSQR